MRAARMSDLLQFWKAIPRKSTVFSILSKEVMMIRGNLMQDKIWRPKARTCAGAIVFFSMALFAQPQGYGKVNINTANAEELDALPGIGPKISAEIIRDRSENGSFDSPEDLARVSGISSGILRKVIDKITVVNSVIGGVKQGPGGKKVVDQKVVKQLLAEYDSEPSVREVQEAAISYSRSHPSIVDSWRIRVRTSDLLPEFRVKVQPNFDRDVRTRTNLDATEAVVETRDNDNSLRLEVQATWDLNEIIFDRDELGVWRETIRMANLRDRVVDEATRRFYERRRLQIDLKLSPSADLADRARKELRMQELTADLDAMTGGWFSERLIAAGLEPY
jgi:competence ComEA-like helix-hairpin-helix protein